jgi:hypothetical protein
MFFNCKDLNCGFVRALDGKPWKTNEPKTRQPKRPRHDKDDPDDVPKDVPPPPPPKKRTRQVVNFMDLAEFQDKVIESTEKVMEMMDEMGRLLAKLKDHEAKIDKMINGIH